MNWKRVGKSVANFWRSLTKGDLLLSMGVHKYYIHVLYLFVLAWISILLSLKVDRTLTRVEENKRELRSLEIYHAEKEAELVGLHSASTTARQLKKLGADVALPQQPAIKIDKR